MDDGKADGGTADGGEERVEDEPPLLIVDVDGGAFLVFADRAEQYDEHASLIGSLPLDDLSHVQVAPAGDQAALVLATPYRALRVAGLEEDAAYEIRELIADLQTTYSTVTQVPASPAPPLPSPNVPLSSLPPPPIPPWLRPPPPRRYLPPPPVPKHVVKGSFLFRDQDDPVVYLLVYDVGVGIADVARRMLSYVRRSEVETAWVQDLEYGHGTIVLRLRQGQQLRVSGVPETEAKLVADLFDGPP